MLTAKFNDFEQPVSYGNERAAVRMSGQGQLASGHARPTVAAPLLLATPGADTVCQTLCNSSRRPAERTSLCDANSNPGPSQKPKGNVANLLLQPNIAANALQQAVMCVLCLDCRVKTCCSDRKQAFWQAFWLLQASPERVGDVMTKKHVWTCNPDTSIDDGQCCAYSSTLTVSCL